MKQYQKTLLIWLVFGLFIISIWSIFGKTVNSKVEKTYSQVLSDIEKGKIKDIIISKQDIDAIYKNGIKIHTIGGYNSESYLLSILQKANKKHQTQFIFKKDDNGSFWFIIVQWLPILLIFALFFYFMKQLQSSGGRALSFGKSKAKILNKSQKKVTFQNIAGIDECKEELLEVIDFLKNPKKFTKLGGKIPRGLLLMGPPGTGKTLLAKAVSGEADVPFFSIAGSDFVEMFVGVGASRVRDLFEQGKKNAPCIIFIDEIDAVGRQRGAGMGGGHDEREQTLNQLLVEMDGFDANDGVIIIAATNRPDVLDPALLRPGRFDRRIVVPKPDLLGREAILKVHSKKVPLDTDVNIEITAKSTPGMSGADLANLINEAALMAARQNKNIVSMIDLENAREKIMIGTERKSMIMSKNELANTAYHEAGHALVSTLLPGPTDPVHKVTIIPRGMALGITLQLPTGDRYNLTKEYLLNQISILMGGRIAEELITNKLTSGAGNDFERATELCKKMICEWGMSSKMGPIVYGKNNSSIFLGRDIAKAPDYSEKFAEEIDLEIHKIITTQYKIARNILEKNITILKKLGDALLEYETIDANELSLIISGHKLNKIRPNNPLITREFLEKKRISRQ